MRNMVRQHKLMQVIACEHNSFLHKMWLLLAGVLAIVASAAPPHNILFLMADQFRFDALGAAGNSFIQTPNLDWLASQGLMFDNMYTSTPSCTPARSAILSLRFSLLPL